MKKRLLAIFILLMIATLTFALVSCDHAISVANSNNEQSGNTDEDQGENADNIGNDSADDKEEKPHSHIPTTVRENEVAATCEAKGSYDEVVYCDDCGDEMSRVKKTTDKLEHTPATVRENEVAATCEAEGSYDEVVYCDECGDEMSRVKKTTDKLEHTPSTVRENEVSKTCTADGSYDEVIYCSECKKELSRETICIPKDHSYINGKCEECGVLKISDGLNFKSYSDGSNGLYITGMGTCTDTDVVIPSTFSVYVIRGIGDGAFDSCENLTSVVIPDTVTIIGDSAFSGCSSLTSVVIPDSVTSIGDSAFSGCSSLTGVVIPDSVISIGDAAFRGCSSLTNIVIPEGVKSIGNTAFSGCDKFVSIVIPDSVKSIGDFAFSGNLESVVIGKGVQRIGDSTFSYCHNLKSIEVDKNNNNFMSIDGNLYSKSADALIQYAGGKTDKFFVIPNTVKSIEYQAFSFCDNIQNVVIPDSSTLIRSNAFFHCNNLMSITIGSNVTNVSKNAFAGCNQIYKIINNSELTFAFGSSEYGGIAKNAKVIVDKDGNKTYNNTLTVEYIETEDNFLFEVEDGTYTLIAYLGTATTITLPNDINGNEYEIHQMLGAADVVIPDGFTHISTDAFWHCDRLTSIVIPDSVISIGSWAFDGCSSLTRVYYKGTAEEWDAINISFQGDSSLDNATRYYYSETAPSADGNYWHYNDDGEVIIWE